mmetsp:Transcript_50880/g.94172  ORF Transcript_50880/g.94172 Transcript_50880/m.94172 type:complete len:90 (+) Transcript_50880:1393-1662(+)
MGGRANILAMHRVSGNNSPDTCVLATTSSHRRIKIQKFFSSRTVHIVLTKSRGVRIAETKMQATSTQAPPLRSRRRRRGVVHGPHNLLP